MRCGYRQEIFEAISAFWMKKRRSWCRRQRDQGGQEYYSGKDFEGGSQRIGGLVHIILRKTEKHSVSE